MDHRTLLLLAAFLALTCSPEPSGVVDGSGVAPNLGGVLPASVSVNSDTILVGIDRKPDDVLSIRVPIVAFVDLAGGAPPVGVVEAWVTSVDGRTVASAVTLSHTGSNRYDGSVQFTIVRTEVGLWNIRVAARATNGAQSSTALIPIRVDRNNVAPFLSNLVAESTVSLSSTDQLLLLTIKAVDVDGKQDIRKVFFNSFLPSGRPSSGNPFQMFDDGNTFGLSGDNVAADSIYSLHVQFAGAAAGTYRFEFRAVDRSSDTSNTIVHQIQVTP